MPEIILPNKAQFDTMNMHLANISLPTATSITIADAGNIITATNVEGALQEDRTLINALGSKTELLCTPEAGYTILAQKSYIINNVYYFTISFKKTDGTAFAASKIAAIRLPIAWIPPVVTAISVVGLDVDVNVYGCIAMVYTNGYMYIIPSNALSTKIQVSGRIIL